MYFDSFPSQIGVNQSLFRKLEMPPNGRCSQIGRGPGPANRMIAAILHSPSPHHADPAVLRGGLFQGD